MSVTQKLRSENTVRDLLFFALRRVGLSEYLVFLLSGIYVAVLAPFVPGFFSDENFTNLVVSLLPLFLVALGQTCVMITGGIDLSVTAVVGLTSVAGATLVNNRSGWIAGQFWAAPVAAVAMVGLGGMIGAVQGLAINRLRMPSFIVTLTGMMFLSGLAIWITKSKNVGDLPRSFLVFGGNPWVALSIASIVGASAHLILSRSLFGRWLFAVGQNSRAARVSGVPVAHVIVVAYGACGACAAVAAILFMGQTETGSPVLGQRILLDVIGAALLGGTSLLGGKGKVLWTLGGVLFLKLLDNSLNLMSLSVFTIMITKGAVILFSALLDVTRRRLAGFAP